MEIGKTMSVCPVCLAKLPAVKTVGEDGNIYLEKKCWEHGLFRTLIWEGDLDGYVNWAKNDSNVPVTPVRAREVERGCPNDCGLCQNHERDGCCVLLELTNRVGHHNAAVQEGRCDIGLSSRSLKDEEKAAGLKETVLAYDGIAVIVSPENPVSDLDIATIAKIYTGEITNWKDVGGADSEIVVIGREAGSGTRDGFESVTGTKDACKYRQELTSTGDVITSVAQNPNAIGYASLASVKDSVKALSVGGVVPTEDTVRDGSYAIQRPFVLVTREGDALSETAQKFFDYVTSGEAADIIAASGAVAAN